ncbi:hypothetical protein K443DRAFT_113994 [Laccaria amethystina LaAM-08-1]|uniref:Unplaced genomic scaffold K443scaffold_395, whole genome shotgun sequence n=1 Tax=Laccaria amethystina LaAM-08-1 TaxID=1095629 RepID=A0A0C9WNR0_9AGAR|nr:hypothetical protein K443DRAFT_113994 [Laccaria amethystina LaAM-08-1]
MSSETVSPTALRRSTRSRQESKKSLAVLSESDLYPSATTVVSTCRSGNDTKKSKLVGSSSTSLKISIPSRKRKREEDPENETQKKARNHNTSVLLGPSKRRDWSENSDPDHKKRINAVIQALLDRRAVSGVRCQTAIDDEKQRIAEREADPCIEWFTTSSVMCAGCQKEIATDSRQSYYKVLWERHRDKRCAGARNIIVEWQRRGLEEATLQWTPTLEEQKAVEVLRFLAMRSLRPSRQILTTRSPTPEEVREAGEALALMATRSHSASSQASTPPAHS